MNASKAMCVLGVVSMLALGGHLYGQVLNMEDLVIVGGPSYSVRPATTILRLQQNAEIAKIKAKRGFVADMSNIDQAEMARIESITGSLRKAIEKQIEVVNELEESVNTLRKDIDQRDVTSDGSWHFVTKWGIRAKANKLAQEVVKLRNETTLAFQMGMLPTANARKALETVASIIEWSKAVSTYYRNWLVGTQTSTETGYLFNESLQIEFEKKIPEIEEELTVEDLVQRRFEELKTLRINYGAVDKKGNIELSNSLFN